jgi:hypothetical protein
MARLRLDYETRSLIEILLECENFSLTKQIDAALKWDRTIASSSILSTTKTQ